MRSSRAIIIVQSTVALALIAAPSLRAQTTTAQESSSSQLTAALSAPTMEPEAPSATTTTRPAAPHVSKWKPETSISLGAFGSLTPTHLNTNNFGTGYQRISNSPGVLGTFRQTFRPWLGYSVNMGYTRATERAEGTSYFPGIPGLTNSTGGTNFTSIPSNTYEVSISHIAHTNLTRRVTLFTEVGAGVLVFLPTHGGADSSSSYFTNIHPPLDTRPAGIFGGGLEYHLTSQLGLRGEYRGQLYRMPDYGYFGKTLTFTSQPTVSLTYTFGAKTTYRR